MHMLSQWPLTRARPWVLRWPRSYDGKAYGATISRNIISLNHKQNILIGSPLGLEWWELWNPSQRHCQSWHVQLESIGDSILFENLVRNRTTEESNGGLVLVRRRIHCVHHWLPKYNKLILGYISLHTIEVLRRPKDGSHIRATFKYRRECKYNRPWYDDHEPDSEDAAVDTSIEYLPIKQRHGGFDKTQCWYAKKKKRPLNLQYNKSALIW